MCTETSGSREDEYTLDPENWDGSRALGHRMLDDMMRYQQTIRSRRFNAPTEEAIEQICVALTAEGEGEERVYDVFLDNILPYSFGNQNPRFWGRVVGTGSTYGMLTEML